MASATRAGVSRRLAEVVSETRCEDLPAAALDEAGRATLDWLGAVLCGALEPPSRMAQQVARGFGESSEATLFAGGRASAAAAAFANGVAAHVLEVDDVHKRSTLHAAAPVISAAFAVAEREHVDGRSLLLAVTLGYDAAFRAGEAVNPSHYRYWHPTGTAATFGAAAAAGSLLGLGTDAMLHALGSAGTQAAGLWEFNADGAMSKSLHPGKAAMNGVLAADLARLGFTGASRILEGERGFFRAMSDTHDETRVTDGLGSAWKIRENCYKLHSCCGHTHTAIDVALALRAQRRWTADSALADIRAVRVDTYGPGYEIVRERNPPTPYQAKFSLAYVVSAALLAGAVGLAQFSEDRFAGDGVAEPHARRMLERVDVRVAEDLTAAYPAAWPTRVEIELHDGTVLRGAARYPRGNPEQPVSTPELESKFLAIVGARYGGEAAERLLAVAREIATCEDVAALARWLESATRVGAEQRRPSGIAPGRSHSPA